MIISNSFLLRAYVIIVIVRHQVQQQVYYNAYRLYVRRRSSVLDISSSLCILLLFFFLVLFNLVHLSDMFEFCFFALALPETYLSLCQSYGFRVIAIAI